MIFTIHKGKHRSWPFIFGLHWNKRAVEKYVTFDRSAKYFIQDVSDMDDINKLFGIGYVSGGHKKDSARFGWNYNHDSGKIRLYSYCFVNGARVYELICELSRDVKYLLSIEIKESNYLFTVKDGHNLWKSYGGRAVEFFHRKRLSYSLGFYFGGDETAPHDISVSMKRK